MFKQLETKYIDKSKLFVMVTYASIFTTVNLSPNTKKILLLVWYLAKFTYKSFLRRHWDRHHIQNANGMDNVQPEAGLIEITLK